MKARYEGGGLGRFLSVDPVPGAIEVPQSMNGYSYVGNNPLVYIDPKGLYELKNTCEAGNERCNRQFAKHAADLKKGLAYLQKRLNSITDPVRRARLQAALKALGTEGEPTGVNVSFGKTDHGYAAETKPVTDSETGKTTFDVKMDPDKIDGDEDYAINGAHEGTHVSDKQAMLGGAPVLTDFSEEFRGYQTSAWVAQALGYPNRKVGEEMIWDSKWRADHQDTLADKGITAYLIGKGYIETQPHNPWAN